MKENQLKGKGANSQLLFGDICDTGNGSGVGQAQMTDVWPPKTDGTTRTSQRHAEAGNFGWLDGHVDTRRPQQLIGDSSSQWVSGVFYLNYWIINGD